MKDTMLIKQDNNGVYLREYIAIVPPNLGPASIPIP